MNRLKFASVLADRLSYRCCFTRSRLQLAGTAELSAAVCSCKLCAACVAHGQIARLTAREAPKSPARNRWLLRGCLGTFSSTKYKSVYGLWECVRTIAGSHSGTA